MYWIIYILAAIVILIQGLDAYLSYKVHAAGKLHWNPVMTWATGLGGIGPAMMVAKFVMVVIALALFQLLYGWWLIPIYLAMIAGFVWVSWLNIVKLGWNMGV